MVTWSRFAGFAAITSGAIAIAIAFRVSLDPDMYFAGHDLSRPQPFVYPLTFFAITCGFIAIYALAAFVTLIKLRWPVWVRSLLVLMVLTPWMLYVSRFFLHMPGFWFVHLVYLWIVVLAIGLAFLISAEVALWHRTRSENASHA